jgi:hypothetical protein
VTVSWIDDGIEGTDFWFDILPCNVLVISPGGKGHIPALLWQDLATPEDFSIVESYEYDAVFCGTIKNHWVRSVMAFSMNNSEGRFLVTKTDRYGWKEVHAKSKFIMAPRGWGRNSFRFGETLQMGMIPVFIYNDVPWVPYLGAINWSELAIIIHIKDVPKTLPYLRNCPVERVNQMRLNVRALYKSHFSKEGVMNQFRNFLRKGFRGSDLRCGKYLSQRGKGFPTDFSGWDEKEYRYFIDNRENLKGAADRYPEIKAPNLWRREIARAHC